MSHDRRKLLEALLAKEGLERPTVAVAGLGQRPPDAPVALSVGEEQLWFLDRVVDAPGTYLMPFVVALEGRPEPATLARALATLAARHDALRAAFPEHASGGPAKEIVAETVVPVLDTLDLRGLDPEAVEAALTQRADEEIAHPFDLGTAPLWRAIQVHSDDGDALLLIVHHIIFDGWSLAIVVRELGALLAHEALGPAAPIDAADYAHWQRQWLTSNEARAQIDDGRSILEGAPVLALPTDHPRPARVRFRGATVPVAIDPGAAQALTAVAQNEGTTLFVALLAVWSALLGRLCGQDDLVVGASVANRDRRETQGVVGFLANMVAVRLDLGPGTDVAAPSLRALLSRARTAVTEALARQEVPFETLVTALRPERDASRNPFFQVAITLEEGGDLGARALPTASSKFDLSLDLRRFADADGDVDADADGLEGMLEYATALFDEASALAMADRFTRLLAASAAEPDRPIDDFDLVSQSERALLAGWNRPAVTSARDRAARVDAARERSITDLFAAQAACTPDAVAVEELGPSGTDVARLTYAELASRVRRLAHHVRSLGVGPEVPVALALAPSVARVVAMLAVVEAGGYYLLIDRRVDERNVEESNVEDRNVEDRGVDAGAASERWSARLDAMGVRIVIGPGALVDLARDADVIPAASEASLPAVVGSQHLLYAALGENDAIVGVPRGAFTQLLHDAGPGWLAAETVLHGATAGPAVAALEVWGPLVSGGRLVILPATASPAATASKAPSLERLGDAIRTADITALWLTDGLFQAMVDHQLDDLLRLRQVLTGGVGSCQTGSLRTVSRDHVRRFTGAAKGRVTLTHLYGDDGAPFATAHGMAGLRRGHGPVPIGRPLGGLRGHVLDHRLRPVPIGVIGTLFLAGEGLARGDLNRPSHTAVRFVPAPSSLAEPPGTRLYDTGERVRWRRRHDVGVLERIAPAGRQWARHGYRTDLSEIEHSVMAHAAVRSAVVVAVPGDDTSRLAAYVVLAETNGRSAHDRPSDDALRAFVGERLPRFLVPEVFVPLACVPLTATGTIDLDALPIPGAHGNDDGRSSDRPRGATEALLAGLWAELLGCARVGRHDNFFDLGGHSLRATRLVSRLRQTFEVDVPLSLPFDAPDLAAMAERIDQRHQEGVPAFEVPIEPVDTSPVAVSFGQERLWFLDRLDPGAAVYNIPLAIDLRGDLEPSRLAQALTCQVARHSALRTRFVTLDGQPHQELLPPFTVALPVNGLTGDDTLAIVESRLAARAFDLDAAPPWHAELLRLDAKAHRLVWVFHHIIVDGWSVDLLVDELADAYQALGSDTAWTPRPHRPTQGTDHAVWQRRWLVDAEQTRQLDHWRDALEGVAVLDLPTDRPRPALQSHEGAHFDQRLDDALWSGIEDLAGRLGATPFMVALAAFRALLYRTAGSRRVAIGTPVAGRRRPELESLVGFCVNTLALATTVDPAASFADLVAAERQVALGAYGHQDLPFERLVEVIEPERDLSRSPVFQVMFVWRDLPPPIEAGGLRWSMTEIDNGTSKTDLTLGIGLVEGQPHLVLEYTRALFDPATAEALLGRYVTLLRHAIDAPATPVARLPMMADGEAAQVARFARGETVEIADASLVQLVEARAAQRPDAIAIESFDGSRQITRAALVARAHTQARALRSLGVGLESRVGVFLERAPDQAVAFLGILAAGGCYVPMKLDFPADRLAFMIEDTGLEVILTRAAYVDRLPPRHAARAVMIDDLNAIEDDSGVEDTTLPVPTSANLAYIMYTSGSTGRPKGVAVSHRNVAQIACHAGLDFTGDTMLQVSPTSFDGSTLEIWGALLVGARLVVSAPEQSSADRLVQVIAARGVTMLGLTTGLFHQLVEHRLEALGSGLRVMTGGDTLSAELARRFASHHGTGTLFNCYGPTEATVHVVRHAMDEMADVGHQAPLGQPNHNATIRLLDDALQPVPPGVAGELYLGGPGLSRGYWGRPDLTAERFVPDPLATTAGQRLYRSGDRARWRRDGRLLFLGRVDDQLKLRGFRIEPGEICAALEGQPSVAAAVVLARPDATGEKRLLAWVEPEPEATLEPAALADALADSLAEMLPAFMLPAAIMVLDALPLTAHGKVDRQALPDPDPAMASAGGGAPEGAIEEVLANIYADVLGHEHVARHDDFFALGGHSLRATQMATRIRRDLGVEIPLRTVFELPRLTDLAAAIHAARGGSADETALPAMPPLVATTPRPSLLPLSFAQERLWFLSKLDPESVAYHIPGFVHLRGVLDRAALEHALNGLVARHETLRTTFHESDAGPVQQVAPPSPLPLPLVDMVDATVDDPTGTALWQHARAEARRPFDLASDAPLRAVLYRLADDDHRLLLVFHHIASDWWSQQIFFDELQTIYAATVEDRQPALPPLALHYADYALWQRSALDDEMLAQQLGHWRDRLAGVPPLDLPDDPNVASGSRDAGGVVDFALDLETTQTLEAYARRAGATPFIVLLALWQATLYRWTGQGDFAVGSPIAGRRVSELEGLVGFFLNTLVLRVALADDPTFAEHVRRVRATTLDAQDHQDLPFERLVDALAPQRDLATTPLFQVQFAFQNELPRAELPGLEARLEPFDMGVTKYPLSLGMGRGPEGLAGTLTYAAARFERATAERLTVAFGRLAEAVIATPDQRISTLPFVDPEEARQIARWSVAEKVHTGSLPVHRLLEQHAMATPERPALIADGGATVLDYQTVLARARRLAHRLHGAGVRPEQRVAIALPRGGDFVIALLAILGAGGAVLPLDIEHPPARRRRLLDTAAVAVVITAAGVDNEVPAAATVIAFDADDVSSASAAPADAWPAPEPAPESLAMVIFTSGSTGTPKGVLVEHRQLSDYADGINRRLAPPPGWTFGLVSTPAADLGLTSLWGAFASGGAVHVVDRATALDPEAFADLATVHPFDALKIVPSHLDALLMSSRPEAVLPRRLLVLGGEAARGDLLRRVRALAPTCRIVNHYGPTEATIGTSSHELPADVEPAAGAAAIGRPLPNGRVEVVDSTGQRVGIGVPGALLLGGPGITRGYLDQPAVTAERFVPDPFATVPGARLYRTGDRARWRSTGLLDFLGRRDHQVKIRGHRVELGEVEAALGALPTVARAAALIVGDAAGNIGGTADDNLHLVAFVVPADRADNADPVQPSQLRRALADQLPSAMVPSRVLVVDSVPLDANGKLDRGALRARAGIADVVGEPSVAHVPSTSLTQRLLAVWRRLLGNDAVRAHDNFFELGGHSLLLVRLQRAMRLELAIEVAVVDLFTHPTVARLVRFLESVAEPQPVRSCRISSRHAGRRDAGTDAVAIVGMAGRFPGAADVEAFWRNLRDGVESIRHFTRDEQRAAGLDPALLDHPNLVAAGGALADVDRFDAGLFGFRPREAAITDPQQRMFLECAWEALEDAAIDPQRFTGRIGVFAGCGRNNYFLHHVFRNPALGDQVYSLEARMGNDKDFLPSRTAYKLELEGPAVAVQTACSTSLVALHMARRSLLDGECEAVLAGGVRIHFPCATGYLYQEGGVVSPDGHCRAFDAAAEGGVPSDGCGTVVLMRLDDALERGAPIRAILRGSAINNDGAAKVGYTAPGVKGQTRVIRDALAAAGITPSDLDVIEAHGTGTHLGDPIEIAALREVFSAPPSGDSASDHVGRPEPCWIGSVKTNIGHLDTAAGITGVIKSVLALEHGAVPPTLHFEQANPALQLDGGPFQVVDRLTPWPRRDGRPRRVGVSSFGIGGTNAHAVLEEAPAAVVAATEVIEANPVPRLLVLSAHGRAALDRTTERLATFLESTPGVALADVAHTLMLGRRPLDQRRVLVAYDAADAAAGLRDPARRLGSRRPADGAPETIFLLPGQGAQYPGMAARLYKTEAHFRAEIDRACAIAQSLIGLDLRTVLFPEGRDHAQAAARLALTAVTQPALFVVETAMARLWQSWGIEPAALLGHSIGELVAAHLAGVWDLETALTVVAERGRLMQAQPLGAMASVPLAAGDVEARIASDAALRDAVDVAVVNAPNVTVVAGAEDAVEAFRAQLADDGVDARRLHVSHAFHSPMMAPAADAFERVLETVPMQAPRIPIVSNVSGTWLSPDDATSAAYWARQIRRPVRFDEGLSTLLATPGRLYLEVGPGNALGGLVRRRAADAEATTADPPTILSSLPRATDHAAARDGVARGVDDALVVHETLGRLWLAGIEPDFAAVDDDGARRFVRLPTYAFERQRYWIEPVTVTAGAAVGGGVIAGDDQPLSAGDGGRPPHLPNDYEAPANGTETKLAAVWSDLFGVERIGVVDGYFDLGGDSLLATQLVARIHETLGYEVTVAQLMEANDVRTLAEHCRQTDTETPNDLDHLVRDLAALSTEELEQLLADDGEGA